MNTLRRLSARAARAEQGITGLETAIILIAFVVVATVFAFVVLSTGVFCAERGEESAFAGLTQARGTAPPGGPFRGLGPPCLRRLLRGRR